MPSFSFIPNEPYYNETQALYIALFDNPQSSNSGGLTYWEGQLAANQDSALNAMSGYVGLGGALSAGAVPLSPSNIGTEINTIYENLFGTAVSSSAATNWANQWTGDGGTLSIGQITAAIYNVVENIPTTNPNYQIYTEVMDNRILNFYNEAQAMYISLFGYPASQSGLTYWENYLAVNHTGALNAISAFAGLDGALIYGAPALSPSNIGTEINNIYEIVFGTPATSKGEAYWSGQWIGDGGTGTMSIAQIATAIYNVVENLPSTNPYYQAMSDIIQGDNYITMFNGTLGGITSSLVNPAVYTLTAADTAYTFTPGAQPDTLVIPLDYLYSSLGQAGNGAYFTFQGDASGHNAVDINYDPVYTSNISYYLADATNFQILDFNYSQSAYSNIGSSPLDLSTINSGFNTFILDDTYSAGNNYSYYGFTNATNNDTFVVQATASELDIFNGGAGNTANVIMDGGANGVGLGTLYFSPSSTAVPAPTINIDSVGAVANMIQLMGDMMITGSNLTGSFTLNVYGSDALSIGSAASLPYSAISTNDNGIELQDGSTLTIAGHSAGSNLTAYIYENSPTITLGVTVNAAGFAGTLSLIENQSNNLSPDTFILGSGTGSVATDYVNALVTVGSGTDTVVSNAAYSTDSSVAAGESSLNTTPGYITTIQGNILASDSITFGTPLGNEPANWQIYPGLFASGIPSEAAGVTISSLTPYNESAASSVTAAITAVIASLEAPWDANPVTQPVSSAGLLDYAGWFQYTESNGSINTYIVNSDQGQNQVVELVGAYNLSSANISNPTTATITNILH